MSKIGFFNLGTGLDPNKTGKTKATSSKVGCFACGRRDACHSGELSVQGKGNKGILFIGEYPSPYEDKKGVVFTKEAKALLADTLDDVTVDLEDDCYYVHAVRCGTEEPKPKQIEYCRVKLLQTIEILKPNVIVPMGKVALTSLLGHRISGRLRGIDITAFYGELIPDQEWGCYIAPTYGVDWLLQQTIRGKGEEITDPVLLRKWKKSIKEAVRLASTPFFSHNYQNDILTTEEPQQAVEWIMDAIRNKRVIAYDYETNALKPHQEGRELVSASFSDGLFGYAFPFFYTDKEFMKAWRRLMVSKKVKKIAHKMDFENGWTRFKGGGMYAQGWEWDTCLASHCLHSTKPTGQKFWTYAYLGVIGYDDGVDKFLKAPKVEAKERGANALNSIRKADIGEILRYNALDSLYCFKIYEIQKRKMSTMGRKFVDGFKFFLKGAEVLSQVQNEGLLVNMEAVNKNERMLTRLIDRAYKGLSESPEWQKWKGGNFNPDSDTQLARMLYDVLGYKEPPRGESKTNEKQLERIGTDFALSILPYRKYKKMRDTYLAQFKREQVDGVIRPFFNLHIPATFRSSSSDPNFQNMPARDPQALKYVMSTICPRKGNKIVEWDYKGVEVTISAMYHKDPNMIKYITDPTTDMHRDTAADILLKAPSEVTKGERQELGKGLFVFPSFYGSGVKAIAPNGWELITTQERFKDTYKHLQDKGIRTYKDFYHHIENVYSIFWGERFPVYRDWKRKVYNDYLKKGYIDLKTGFRYSTHAQFTQVTNAQIQGSAFHVLLWSLSQIYPIIKANFSNSFIIGQIHDAIVGDVNPNDEKVIDEIIKEYGTKKVREHWDWITLPLQLEKESTEVDGTWDTMQGRGYI